MIQSSGNFTKAFISINVFFSQHCDSSLCSYFPNSMRQIQVIIIIFQSTINIPWLTAVFSIYVYVKSTCTTSPESVNTSWIVGQDGAFSLSWSSRSAASCGYTVDWCPASGRCEVEWVKVPPNVTSVRIFSSKSYDLKIQKMSFLHVYKLHFLVQ